MKNVLFLIVILAATVTAQLFASLGNGEKEIAALYGDPISSGDADKNGVVTKKYQHGDYAILVQFLSHHSLAESHTRTDLHEFSQEELSNLLRANSQGFEWKKNPRYQDWERSDHHARAWCETVAGRPTFLVHAK